MCVAVLSATCRSASAMGSDDQTTCHQAGGRTAGAIPFVGPEALERQLGHALPLRLGANESAFGISPLARQAMQATLERVACYGDPEVYDLRVDLAQRHGVTPEEIAVGSGIDDLLGVAVRAFLLPRRGRGHLAGSVPDP